VNTPLKASQRILSGERRALGSGATYCGFAIYKTINLKIEIEKCVVSMKYVLLHYTVHMPKEERLRTP
jgi:hypothetical protein